YRDLDGDGYGDASNSVWSCSPPPGFVANTNFDCNDVDANVHPGAPEVACDATDNNCNGLTDEIPPAPFFIRALPATGAGPSSIGLVDFNGDGRKDLAVTNLAANTVSVMLGDGFGGFGAHVDYVTGSQPRALAIADLNGDGKPDLVTANSAT